MSTQTDGLQMPPLPKPMGLFCGTRCTPPRTREFWGMVTGDVPDSKCDIFTTGQLHAYAQAYADQQVAAYEAGAQSQAVQPEVRDAEKLWLLYSGRPSFLE